MESTQTDKERWLRPKDNAKVKIGADFQALLPSFNKKEEKKGNISCDREDLKNKLIIENNLNKSENSVWDDRWMKLKKKWEIRIGDKYQVDIPTLSKTPASCWYGSEGQSNESQKGKKAKNDAYPDTYKRAKFEE